MIYKIQVVTVSQDGYQETLEIACVERTDLKPETLGLTLAEGKRYSTTCSRSSLNARCRAHCY